MNEVIIALVGMPGCGKSTVAEVLEERGWVRITFGDLTRDELDQRKLPYTQPNERMVREALRSLHGPAAYAKLLLPKITGQASGTPIVIDGLYSWAEYRLLIEKVPNMLVVLVYADRKVRYQRLQMRPIRPLTPVEAFDRDTVEIETLHKGGPIAMADRIIVNNATQVELIASIHALAEEVEKS